MLILCIDTVGADCAALVWRDGAVAAQARETLGRGHAERLAPMTRAVLAKAGAAPGDLDRVAVLTGPGGFAGVRVGVAFARGLALALGVPALGLSQFDLLADAHRDAPLLVAAHDAGRGEIALRVHRFGVAQTGVLRLSVADAAAMAGDCGQGALLSGSGAGPMALLVPGACAAAHGPADLARMACLAAQADPADFPPDPLYVRPPDAKLPAAPFPGGGDPALTG